VVVSRIRNTAAFLASGLPEPPEGKVYQLWFADGGSMRSAGLMDEAGDTGAAMLEGTLDGASGIGITVEPAGGSAQPTSDPLALLTLPA
jgi:anti-sigma-K factor RskA